ncbi:unnamed protein product [Darwinula stevensoni]|uniref:glutathione transferase n=1 Tax=Darwinula stevensoni TaxID=69355 RepID=A0A7R8XCZ2_9CRUS|nr:unnamed protein product [Darwinula stevensoni]CAG0894172.1 unnamed protein product [Darwinula stevensoni]
MVLAQPIRNLLTYTGVEWEDKVYEASPPDGPGRQAWENDKTDGLGLDFPNLPYYIDGDVKLSQSLSIIRHLGRKHGLYGQTEEEQCRQDMAEQQQGDFQMAMIRAVYYKFTPESKAQYLEEALPTHLKIFTMFIGNRNWLLGDRLTYVDFLWYEVLDWQLYLDPECFKDFPVLPYYIDGDVKLSQSLAILRYLGRKHGLYGQTEEEQCRQDMIEQQHGDLNWARAYLVYFNYNKEKYLQETLPPHLELFTKFIGNSKWLVGDRLTYVDFLWYESLDWQLYLGPECFNDFPVVRDFMDRFESLPNIKEYLKSDKFQKWPLFGPMAQWGYKEEDKKLRFPDG